jgi:hypothetical protein
METLRDIHGLDAIPSWPLAPGWWLLLLGCGLLVLGLLLLWWRLPYWRLEAYWRLWWLARRWQRLPPKQLASELSELLRRIALVRFGRRACAGLSGDAWLAWLHTHDPRGFDWSRHGALLLALPYAPPDATAPSRQLRLLLAATRAWVVPSLRRKRRGHA